MDTAPGALRTGGHGLTLVAALCDHWDCVPCPPSGKTVRNGPGKIGKDGPYLK